MDKDYQDYKDFDMTGATRGIPPQIARLQAKYQAEASNEQSKVLDDDVLAWACTQDQSTRHYINEMIRGLMAFQQRKAIS